MEEEVSVSYNYATKKYEVWGVDKNGNAGITQITDQVPTLNAPK